MTSDAGAGQGGKAAASSKRGGGDRAYMQDFGSGRDVGRCQSCASDLRRESDFGTEADGSRSELYCSACYADGAFVDDVSSLEEFISVAAGRVAEAHKTGLGKIRLTLKKDGRKLERWK
jgi:hypothetical protein